MPRTTTAVQPEESPAASAPPASYEAAMAELETLVASMESGELPLEASVFASRAWSGWPSRSRFWKAMP
jgi:exodeoxyribonuclease VII small subunit